MGKVWEAGSGLNRKGIQGKCVYKKKEGKRNKEEKQESQKFQRGRTRLREGREVK